MGKYKFDEVLNDLMDYFILGDPDYLLQYKIEQNLPDDLLTEFTTKETGDYAVRQGVLIPMIGIENYPYTVYFTLQKEPELLKTGNQLQHKRDGYCLRVNSGRIYLYTIPYLRDYTVTKIAALKEYKQATIEIPNGWYTVSVLGGLTKQAIEITKENGDCSTLETMEPTFEFLLTSAFEKPAFSGDIMYSFKVEVK